jgi:predicted enzyme related to lactoylglutathione lyase
MFLTSALLWVFVSAANMESRVASADPLTDRPAAPGIRLDLVVIDCPEPRKLARFYSALLDWPIAADTEEWASVRSPAGSVGIAFQRDPDFQPPHWDSQKHAQMKHLDFDVTDLNAQEARAVGLGASLVRDNDRRERGFRVYADPAGHFFCLCTEGCGG